jgi:hypothetical protein
MQKADRGLIPHYEAFGCAKMLNLCFLSQFVLCICLSDF